ncbi:uncharacterized protein [Palaemon carinicauda]|uniref:uncharacterized protein n=1 Tax=Palaemon carinicauda TaxID=392227 RepID=UPI0035B5C59F
MDVPVKTAIYLALLAVASAGPHPTSKKLHQAHDGAYRHQPIYTSHYPVQQPIIHGQYGSHGLGNGLHVGSSFGYGNGFHGAGFGGGHHVGANFGSPSGLHGGSGSGYTSGFHGGSSLGSTSGLHGGSGLGYSSGFHGGSGLGYGNGHHGGSSFGYSSGIHGGPGFGFKGDLHGNGLSFSHSAGLGNVFPSTGFVASYGTYGK